MAGGLKNRGYTREDVDERRAAAEEFTGTQLENISRYCFEPEQAKKNVENMIGAVQIPLGYAGPVTINGGFAKGEFLVPLATTEGALIASISRGMSVIAAAGGANAIITKDMMTRAPVFEVRDLKHGSEVVNWINKNTGKLKIATGATTSHGQLALIEHFLDGRNLYVRFGYHTGDAMGMNMATIATEAACKVICEYTGAKLVSVSGNMCSDKKPAAINLIRGRGKTVLADVRIPKEIVEEKLHATAAMIADTNLRKNLMGSIMAGALGGNAHAANMVAALYLATGQDPAQVVGGSMTITSCEDIDGDLYICVNMPVVEVGTVGGGTSLPCQKEALSMMGCHGEGKARKFAEIVAVTVLAGELSTLAAQAAGQLGEAHQQLGR